LNNSAGRLEAIWPLSCKSPPAFFLSKLSAKPGFLINFLFKTNQSANLPKHWEKRSSAIIFQLHLVVKSEHYFVQLKSVIDHEKENIQ